MRRATVLALALVLAACSGGRSTEAFCSTLDEETQRLNEKYRNEAAFAETQGGMMELILLAGDMVEVQGDTVTLFARLAEVAPEEIQADVEAVHQVLDEQFQALREGSILEALATATIGGLQMQGSAERVDQFILTNC